MNIAILIRVYNRVDDLLYNLQIIAETWHNHVYDIYVISNGKESGYKVPDNICTRHCHLIELPSNSGHFSGNAQLLIEGARQIDFQQYDYVLILEADTWVYGDAIITRYAHRLSQGNAVWASARWYDKYHSLATDFALIDARFLAKNTDIFNFAANPECCVYNYLYDRQLNSVYITENMPVMLPGYIKHYPYAPKGRFYVFPKSRMVTHHVEDYAKGDGFQIKKQHFNTIAGITFFTDVPQQNTHWEKLKMRAAFLGQHLLLHRSWYSKRARWQPSMPI